MKCNLIFCLIFLCGFASVRILALRCITSDGLQSDQVRKIMKKCMKKVTSSDGGDEVKNYDEYENFEIGDYEMKDNNNNNNGGGGKDNRNDRMNENNNYNPYFNQYDERSTQTGGNYRRTYRPRNDRYDPWQQQQQQQQQQPFNPYQTQLTSSSSYAYVGGNNNYLSNNQRADSNRNDSNYSQNKNPNDNSTSDKSERDRSCILQCFFQELKMVLTFKIFS
jgi:hypothetical protein